MPKATSQSNGSRNGEKKTGRAENSWMIRIVLKVKVENFWD